MAQNRARQSVVDRIDAAVAPRLEPIRAALASPVRDERMTVVIGRLLGTAFVICFVTGVYSHLLQSPVDWIVTPTRPVHLFGWTQGVHVTVGAMLIPLLLAKLWVVFPGLLTWPPVTSVRHLLVRISIAVLVATAITLPITGVLNVLKWYPWDFSFRRTHFALAWVLVGALAIHIAVQLPIIRTHWRATTAPGRDDEGKAG